MLRDAPLLISRRFSVSMAAIVDFRKSQLALGVADIVPTVVTTGGHLALILIHRKIPLSKIST